eukprot:9492899-Pyramimonas_sp.AAC.1
MTDGPQREHARVGSESARPEQTRERIQGLRPAALFVRDASNEPTVERMEAASILEAGRARQRPGIN